MKKIKNYIYMGVAAHCVSFMYRQFSGRENGCDYHPGLFEYGTRFGQLIVGTYNAERVNWGNSEGYFYV